jgi:hypothetical protein
VKSARNKGMTRKNQAGNWGEKPNQRRARQFIHLAIAAKYLSIFSGLQSVGKR